jgi:hypothetical protein
LDVTKPHEFIGFGAMDVTKPYEFMGFGAMDVNKPYEFIRFGSMDVNKPYEFIGFAPATFTRCGDTWLACDLRRRVSPTRPQNPSPQRDGAHCFRRLLKRGKGRSKGSRNGVLAKWFL